MLLITGEVNGTILLAGEISLIVTIVAGIAGYFFLRGERSARWLGAKLQRPLSWILIKLKRDPIEHGAEHAAQLRTSTSPPCAKAGRSARSESQPTSASPT